MKNQIRASIAWRHAAWWTIAIAVAVIFIWLMLGSRSMASHHCETPENIAATLTQRPNILMARTVVIPVNQKAIVAIYHSGSASISLQAEPCQYDIVWISADFAAWMIDRYGGQEA